MAKDKNVTMQRLGTSVSVAGQGEQADFQASSSRDRSLTRVGNLAFLRSNATSHVCEKNPDVFCFICSKFVVAKDKRKITAMTRNLYKECFNLDLVDEGVRWVPHHTCGSCYMMMNRFKKTRDKRCLKFSIPKLWDEPQSEADCYFCNTDVSGYNSISDIICKCFECSGSFAFFRKR